MRCHDRINASRFLRRRFSQISRGGSRYGSIKEICKVRRPSSVVPFPADCPGVTGSDKRIGSGVLLDLGGRIAATSGDEREGREGVFLFQRLSVILQHYNSIMLHNSFVMCDDPDLQSFQ